MGYLLSFGVNFSHGRERTAEKYLSRVSRPRKLLNRWPIVEVLFGALSVLPSGPRHQTAPVGSR